MSFCLGCNYERSRRDELERLLNEAHTRLQKARALLVEAEAHIERLSREVEMRDGEIAARDRIIDSLARRRAAVGQ